MTPTLNVRTKSIATAAAIAVLTGEEPRVLVRRDSEPMFEFSPETEPALRTFLRAKQRMDVLADEASR